MKSLRIVAVVPVFLALLALAGAAPRPDPERLLRAGATAFHEGEYARAEALFEEAERYTTEPRRVAFDLASAKYRLALEDGGESARLFREAEQLYRCCLKKGHPHRTEALYGLGNCLVQRTDSGEALRGAVAAYRECLREPGLGARLEADVRYNLQHALLRLAQFDPSRERGPEEPPPHEGDRPPDRPPDGGRRPEGPDERGGSGEERPGERGPGARPEAGDRAGKQEGEPEPGAGQLPPVPDSAEPMPLSPQDAAEHLRRATRRIVEERLAYRASRVKPPSPEVRDW
jgi:hypothetical protein